MKLRTLFIASIGALALLGCSPSQTNPGEPSDRQHYSDAYKKVSEAMASSQVEASKKNKRPDSFSSYDSYFSPADPGTNVLGTQALVYFLHLVYDNIAFPITDKPVTFDCDWIEDGKTLQENSISMVSSMDKEKGSIICDVYGDSHFAGTSESLFYINVDIDYDFVTSTVKAFRLDMVGIKEGLIDRSVYTLISKYEDGQYKMAFIKDSMKDGRDGYLDLLEETYWKPYAEKLNNAITVDAEFSKEYSESMKIVYPDGLPY